MGELLRLVFVLVGIWLVIRLLKRHLTDGHTPQHPPHNRPSGSVTMLACARCGVYLPHGEAIKANGRVFCSREHAAIGPGK